MHNESKDHQQRPASSRRSILKNFGASVAGLSLANMIGACTEEQIAFATQNVRRSSSPSQLRITDLRVAVVSRAPMRCPLIRIDTNQDICGYGEVRDGASERYALMLKSRLLRQNPCDVEPIFKRIKQFGHHGRQGGGVSGVEMYGVPVYQMLGGRYRDRVRLYADTPGADVDGLKKRVEQGFTFLKMDCGISKIFGVPGALTYPAGRANWWRKHPFTRIQLSDKGAELLAERFAEAREAVGWQIPVAADHFGHIGVNSCIRLGKALQPYQLAWLEDMVPWEYTDMLKEIKNAIDVPLLTGEDIYLLEGFKPLIDGHAVDMVHPDLATAGGIMETAFRRHTGLLHGQCTLCRGHGELHRSGASLGRCRLVGGPRERYRQAPPCGRFCRRAGRAGPGNRIKSGRHQGAPLARSGAFCPDRRMEPGPLQRPPVELRLLSRDDPYPAEA